MNEHVEEWKNIMNNKRNTYVDIMRGIGILFVIMGHVYAPHISKYIICSFHMPLFFVLSGYFFNSDRKIKEVIYRGLNKLIVPYFITCIVVITIQFIVCCVNHYDCLETFRVWTVASLYGLPARFSVGNVSEIERIGAIWFLEALFWGQVILVIILKIRNDIIKIGTIISMLVVICLISQHFWFPANLGTGIATVPFLYVGYCIRNKGILRDEQKSWKIIAFLCSGLCIVIAFVKQTPFVPAYLQFPLYGFDIVGGICGTYLTYLVARFIYRSSNHVTKMLSEIGNASREILCFHLVNQNCLFPLIGSFLPNVINLILRLIIDATVGLLIHNFLRRKCKSYEY